MKRKFKKGAKVKFLRQLTCTIRRAINTCYPFGPYAGEARLILKSGTQGIVLGSLHEEFQGWYIVEFPVSETIVLRCDVNESNLEKT